MKWIIFTGTWRLTNKRIESDVREAVREVLERGDGVLTGGATGVDYFAMDEAMRIAPACTHLRIIIPAQLESYIDDYHAHWCQAPVSRDDIDKLAKLLRKVRDINPASLLEMDHHVITQEHYDLRHAQEVLYGHEVYAFHVNKSPGTQDTINKALDAGLPISLYKTYAISE